MLKQTTNASNDVLRRKTIINSQLANFTDPDPDPPVDPDMDDDGSGPGGNPPPDGGGSGGKRI